MTELTELKKKAKLLEKFIQDSEDPEFIFDTQDELDEIMNRIELIGDEEDDEA